jgi:hypothetical protein
VTKRLSLPDFGEYFRTNSRSPIDFVCREGPNLLHDLVFLSSYIHDASFEISKLRLSGKTLRIPMQRDRWERYETSRELESVAAKLVISPVLALKWEPIPKTRASSRSNEFFIRDVYLGESFWDSSDRADIVLSSNGKNPRKLRIIVRDPFSIRLQDASRKQ